jgi:hypothetical protein
MTSLLEKHPNICQEEFYNAIPPWEISEEEAIKLYVKHMKEIELEDPDSDDSILRLKKSLKFVYLYCQEHGIKMEDYVKHGSGPMVDCVSHLKAHNITFYTLHALTFSPSVVESELLEFVIPNFYITFQKTKNKFYSSKKMKALSKLAKEKLNERL